MDGSYGVSTLKSSPPAAPSNAVFGLTTAFWPVSHGTVSANLRGRLACGYLSHPRDVAQSGSAPEWGSGGRRFESGRPDWG